MSLLAWLITPAAVFGIIVAVAPLVEPLVRWSRRLKSDIAVVNGLPEGPEKEKWERGLVQQARRLRLYRKAMRPRRWVAKVVILAYSGGALVALILWPPINQPGDKYPLTFADYYGAALGAVQLLLFLIFLSTGRNFEGRTIAEMLVVDRIGRYRRRWKRLERLNRLRKDAIDQGEPLKLRGSTLGFRTQVDPLGEWVSSEDMRTLGRFRGVIAGDLSEGARKNLRSAGRKVPAPTLPPEL